MKLLYAVIRFSIWSSLLGVAPAQSMRNNRFTIEEWREVISFLPEKIINSSEYRWIGKDKNFSARERGILQHLKEKYIPLSARSAYTKSSDLISLFTQIVDALASKYSPEKSEDLNLLILLAPGFPFMHYRCAPDIFYTHCLRKGCVILMQTFYKSDRAEETHMIQLPLPLWRSYGTAEKYETIIRPLINQALITPTSFGALLDACWQDEIKSTVKMLLLLKKRDFSIFRYFDRNFLHEMACRFVVQNADNLRKRHAIGSFILHSLINNHKKMHYQTFLHPIATKGEKEGMGILEHYDTHKFDAHLLKYFLEYIRHQKVLAQKSNVPAQYEL